MVAPDPLLPPAPEPNYYYPEGGTPGYEPVPSASGYVPFDPFGTRFSFRSDIGDGPGWGQGFQSLNAFLPIQFEPDRSLLFLNPRAMATNNGQFAFSGGGGIRWYSPETDRVFGGSFWYDYDDSGFTNYDQWGISLESLGKYFDMRVNAYVPSNDNQSIVSSKLNGQFGFVGQNIALGNTLITENALRGGDLEIGGATPWLGDYGVRSYIGGYYFQAQGVETTVGFKYRSELMITEDIIVGIGASSDKLFGENVYGQVTFYFPDGRPQRILSRQPVRERLYANVERNYRVNIFRNRTEETIKAINPDTGLPYVVHHVDNHNAPGTGDGSVKNPFGTLSDAPPGADIIFVHHNNTDNNGDPILIGYDTGITLLDNQRLLGQGTEHFFNELNHGVLVLPGNDNGPLPIITNPVGDVVTLANRNEVSGLQIGAAAPNAPGGNGIFGSDITDFNINRNTIINAAQAGVSLTNAAGTGSIVGNTISGNTLENVIISNTGTAPLTLDVEDNDLSASLAGIVLRGDASDITATVANNDLSNNLNNGFDALSSNGGTMDLTMTDNVANSNGGSGFQLTADGGSLTASMHNSTGNLNTASGLSLNTVNNGTLTLDASDNNFSNNQGSGLTALADSGTIDFTDFSFTTLNNNTLFGIDLTADNGGQVNGTMTNNSLQNNGAGGLRVALNNGGQSTVTFTDNVITGNNGFALTFSALNGSLLSQSLSNIELQNNAGGINVIAESGSQVTFALDSSNISNNTGIGFQSSITDSQSDISLLNNLFDNNQDAGILLGYAGASLGTQLIDGNTITDTTNIAATVNPTGEGLIVQLTGGGGAPNVSSTIQNNTIQNNATDGILQTLSNGTALMPVNTVSNNNIIANGQDGFRMTMSASSIAVLNASNNNILTQSTTGNPAVTVNGVDGINIDIAADSLLTANISNNTIDGSSNGVDFSTGSGVVMNIRNDATLNATLTANIFRQNGLDGVHVGPDRTGAAFEFFHANQETSHINITLQGNLVEDNQRDGVHLYVSQVSQGAAGFTGNANFNVTGNTIRNNGRLVNGNRVGDGVNADVRSGQMDLVLTNNIITDNVSDGVELRNSMGWAGGAEIVNVIQEDDDSVPQSVLNALVDGNTINNNGNNGVFIAYDDLDPFDTGSRFRQGVGARGDITLSNNLIDNNRDNGVYVLMNTQHDDNLDFGGWDSDSVFVDETLPGPTINLANEAEVTVTVVGNTITNNGGGNPPDPLGQVAGDGLFILVGTGSYVRADIRDNTFSGNFLDDFHTDSYVAGPDTPPSEYNDPADGTTQIFLDRAARLDLRFTGNTGNSIGGVATATNSSRFIPRIVDGIDLGGTIHNGSFPNTDPDVDAPEFQQKPFVGRRTTDFFRVEDTPTPVGSVLNGTNFFTDADSQFPREVFANAPISGYQIVPIGSLFP